jgi:paraquat-inducible protein A
MATIFSFSKWRGGRRWPAAILWAASVLFFILGITHPILETGFTLDGWIDFNRENIYLISSFQYFINKGDVFIAVMLLTFTIVLPVVKYIFLLLGIAGVRFKSQKKWVVALDIINKWSMLDVFVVAQVIMNLKFNQRFIISNLQSGITYFAVSIVLMMVCSLVMKYSLKTTTPAVTPGSAVE